MIQHVYPTSDIVPHATVGIACWCKPTLRNLCPECDEQAQPTRDCCVCAGEGTVVAICDSQPDLVVHHRYGDPEAE